MSRRCSAILYQITKEATMRATRLRLISQHTALCSGRFLLYVLAVFGIIFSCKADDDVEKVNVDDYFTLNETDLLKLEAPTGDDVIIKEILESVNVAEIEIVSTNLTNNETFTMPVVNAVAVFKCYECNSFYDSDCAESDGDMLVKFETECSKSKPSRDVFDQISPIGCRKILQSVRKDYRIIRQCAFTEKNMAGKKRVGSKDVLRYLYQCDANLCNGVISIHYTAQGLFMALVLPLYFLLY